MAKCKKCPIQDECKRMNRELRKRRMEDSIGIPLHGAPKITLCPLRVLADDVFSRYSRRAKKE